MTKHHVRITAPGASVLERIRMYRAARHLRRMITRHGYKTVADTLEKAAREVGVTVHRQHPDLPKVRRCPVDSACEPQVGWEALLVHVYEIHTADSEPEWCRQEIVQRLLERGPAR